MTLIYYRDKDGKILRYQQMPKGWTLEQLEAEMEKFNKVGDVKVYRHEVEDGSLEMFLFEKAKYRKRYSKEIIRAALDAIEEARDAIDCIDVEGGDNDG